jgi:cobaltochelatase CobN
VYVEDKHKLGMKEFFEQKSPFAYQDITARMVETIRKNYWKADDATRKKLVEEYLGSVNRHGVGCAEHTCGNPRLSKYVLEQARAMGIPVPAIEGFQKAMEKAIGNQVSKAAQTAEEFVRRNEELTKVPPQVTQNRVPAPRQGYVMEVTERNTAPQRAAQVATGGDLDALWISLPVLGMLFAWRWRYRTRRRPG